MTNIADRLGSALAIRYRIEREIGAGGMATVYLAQDVRHHRRVALKVLRPELAAILGAERFLQEIQVTANLQHPNILPLYDSGEADSFLYYVMPYVEGESLRIRLEREKMLSIEDTVRLTSQVAGALDYAHRHAVIHRDIKPENILLHDGQALVTDFGIALAVSQAGATRLTETGLSLGTPQYMSPEQATGDRVLDARSDVYSLGCVVYEMLTGDPPHTGRTVQAIVAKVLSEEPVPITRTRRTVPNNVEAAVRRALAKTPADRFPTAAQFADALANPAYTWSGAATAAPASAVRGDWRSRLAVPLMGLVLALGGLALWGWLRPEPPPPVRRSRLAIAPPNLPCCTLLPAFSPDGSRLVIVAGAADGPAGMPQLYLQNRDQLDATPIAGTVGGVAPFFSPDGRKLAYYQFRPRTLRVMGVGGEPPVTLATDNVAAGGGTWGPDGYLYVPKSSPGGLARIPETGGTLEPVTTLGAGETGHVYPDALPNGRGIVFTVVYGREDRDIAVVDLATRKHTILIRGGMRRYAPSGHLIYVTAEGTLLAVPFDADRLMLSGSPVALAEGIAVIGSGHVDLALSSTGDLLYVAGVAPRGPEQLVWVTRDGTATPIDSSWTGNFGGVALSPDGTRLAAAIQSETEQHIWVKQLDRGPALKLTTEGKLNLRPAWSPDGRTVLFESEREGSYDIYARSADGSAPATKVLDRERGLHSVLRSRDGRWLVLREGPEPGGATGRDIIAVRAGLDSAPIPIAATSFDEQAPTLSPDGRYLAHVSDESGRPEVYVRPFPDAGRARWQVSVDGGNEPLWANSGRELFYRSQRTLMVASVATQPSFSIGERKVLLQLDQSFPPRPGHRSYDISSDDRRFVMIKSRPLVGLQVILVENWFTELKSRMGTR